MKRFSALAIAMGAVAAVAAGCGSSTSTSSTAATNAASPVAHTTSTPTATPPQQVALITTKRGKLGTILAYGPKKLTVYLFAADKGSMSTCNGGCADDWPPITGAVHAAGGAHAADLGTTKRADGVLQATYKGHPLYLFAKDKDDGDLHGQAIVDWGADWYALNPKGATITTGVGNDSDDS